MNSTKPHAHPTPPPSHEVERNVAIALAEDVGPGDLTAGLIPASTRGEAEVTCRDAAVICGAPWFNEVFAQLDPGVRIDWRVDEGEAVEPGRVVCALSGPARALLTGERTALNFLQTLSATATAARRFAQAVAGTGTLVLDTRKTLPGLRQAQKYASRCGGCTNHRLGLYDGILVKENHILAAGSITQAVAVARRQAPDRPVEVEVENLEQLDETIEAGADMALLDNFGLEDLRRAVKHSAKRVTLEASGGVNLESVGSIAATGVDYVSVGEITKDVRAVDLSMRFRLQPPAE